MRSYVRPLAALVSIALVMPTAALAETPRDIQDLVGARAAGGENALQQRGYVHIKTEKGDDRAWSYWWQSSARQCVSVVTLDGRYDSITSSPAPDCNQSERNSDGTAAAVAIGAAALIGAIALAHKSHHHADGAHSTDEASEAQFERGHRDGLYNQSYHNYDRNDAYARGYESGVQQRSQETSYRDQHASDRGGYRASTNVADLVGARESSADGELQRRGFANVGNERNGNSSYSIWYSRNTGQCLQMGIADGRVANLVDIGTHPGCR